MTRIEVVGAVIVRGGLVLCAQRGPGGSQAGRWEFPGGKVESGEPPRAALAREIVEELGAAVTVGDRIETTEHEEAFGTIVLTTFYCTLIAGEAEPALTEHVDARWLAPSELMDLDWAPADVPAVRRVARDLGRL
ncbi:MULTISPECIES: (deoxy)nucleoside triphosphate pyrophosphohydrolase [unclassified Leucobacter]|uniref:(deoxy)nucleoside triphosphate pyrophosphohydrolase n=1 Tax=unclassified Leucobacter TaxID=2621730 RepID=UPI00165E4075|nr:MULTISPECIES: (deoxy)nucleoside triphosphate pyrophosphohydrolase [unclassified Leucobacter]MBC9928626.1 (deoxy)nucleoside triphosphate pyrophosphohydrolase [Leucobacter sp. cx-169]